MFSNISQNPPEKVGKIYSKKSIHGKSTTFSLGPGIPENEKFVYRDLQANPPEQPIKHPPTINLGDMPNDQQYISNCQVSYQQIPAGFQKVVPLIDKSEVHKTNYALGTDPSVFQSSAMGEFQNPRPASLGPFNTQYAHNNSGKNTQINPITGETFVLKASQIQKNQGKYNVLTNQDKSDGPTSGYEAYSSDQIMARKSNNKATFPQDMYVSCPITGRLMLKK